MKPLPCTDTYAFTFYTSYSAFWFSYGILLWPSSNGLINSDDAASALGLYFIVWWLLTFVSVVHLLTLDYVRD